MTKIIKELQEKLPLEYNLRGLATVNDLGKMVERNSCNIFHGTNGNNHTFAWFEGWVFCLITITERIMFVQVWRHGYCENPRVKIFPRKPLADGFIEGFEAAKEMVAKIKSSGSKLPIVAAEKIPEDCNLH